MEQIVALSSGLQGWQKLNVETTVSHKFLEKLSRNFQVSRGNHVRNQSFSKVSRETFEKLPSFSRHLREKLKFLTSFSRNFRETSKSVSHKFLEKLSRNFQVSRGNHVRNQSFSKVSRETFEKLPSFSRHLHEKLKFLTSFSRNLCEKPTKCLQTLDAETFRLLSVFFETGIT